MPMGSIVGARSLPVVSPPAVLQQATRRGWSALCRHREGLPCASVSVRSDFRDSFPLSRTRDQMRSLLGVDVGFDLAEEGFTAMLALAHLPRPGPERGHALMDVLARQVTACGQDDRYRFFPRVPEFAADTDCTAVAAAGLYRHRRVGAQRCRSLAAQLLLAGAPAATGQEDLRPGAVMVYWEDDAEPLARRRGRKHDAVVSANVLRALALGGWHATGAGHPVAEATLAHVEQHLLSGGYVHGTRYYPSPASFLFAVARLCATTPRYAERLARPLRRACAGAPCRDPLELALLTAAADLCGYTPGQEPRRERLAACQRPDGLWPAAAYFRMGRFPVYFGSPHLTTVFALRALAPGTGHGRTARP